MDKTETIGSTGVLDDLLTDKQVAKALHVSLALVRLWRHKGGGPAWVRVGKALVRYRPSSINEYLDAQAVGGRKTAA